MVDFEAGWHKRLNVGKRQEASRATQLITKSSAHQYIGS